MIKYNLHVLYKRCGLLFLMIMIVLGISGNAFSSEEQEYKQANGEIVAVFYNSISDTDLEQLMRQFGTKVTIKRHIEEYALLAVENSRDYHEVLTELKNDPMVAEVQGNIELSSLGFSNDTYSDAQWAIDNQGHYVYLSEIGNQDKPAVAGIDMDVLKAWTTLKTTANAHNEVVVAIIDTGVDYRHPDLADHMWMNEGEIPGDNIDNDKNGYVDDVYGWDFYNDDSSVCHYKYSEQLKKYIASPKDNDDHGTHVAGIIGAAYNNNIGIAGVASRVDVKIMSLKINGGPKGTGSLSRAVEAVKYATMMGADICNMSWGTNQYTASLERVMRESDMLFVAAAGNTGDDNDQKPIYPAGLDLDNLISVTFIDSSGELTPLSNYGAATVDLAAPGEDIFSTVVGDYDSMSGSSMAAPQVTSVAALLYACSNHIYASEVKELILGSIKHIPQLNGYLRYGGIPSAYQALASIDELTGDTDEPEIGLETRYEKENMVIPVYAHDIGASGIRVLRWSFGEKTKEDFARGIWGTQVEDNQIIVSRAGLYTFYASDYSGNETVMLYQVKEDMTPPGIISSFSVADDYQSRTITVRVTDIESHVKRLEYMAGKHSAEEFLPASEGTVAEVKDGKAKIKVKQDGIYSIFAIDYRGNMTVQTVNVKTEKSVRLKLSKKKYTMTAGEKYTLRAYLTPSVSTDRITFLSSDETVATVSATGRITAVAAGTAVISVRTSSGLKANCKITVKKNSSG